VAQLHVGLGWAAPAVCRSDSARPRRSSLHSERQQRLGAGNGYHPLRMVSQVVEDMLHELTIKDVEEKATSPAGLSRDSSVRASQLDDQTTRSH
jgi:hypothetical protein